MDLPLTAISRRKTNSNQIKWPNFVTDIIIKVNLKLSNEFKVLLTWYFNLGYSHLVWIERLTRPRKYDIDIILPTRYLSLKIVLFLSSNVLLVNVVKPISVLKIYRTYETNGKIWNFEKK